MLIKEEIASTNTYLRSLSASHPETNFIAVLASYQSQGRGQFGRVWDSQKGKNLLFSVMFRPAERGFSFPQDGFWLAMQCLDLIAEQVQTLLPQPVSIKWPNDLYVEQKKIGGMLLETVVGATPAHPYAVLGVGINVNQTDFEMDTATSLSLLTGQPQHVFRLAHQLEQVIQSRLFFSPNALDAYMKRLLFTQSPSALYLNEVYYPQAYIKRVHADGSVVVSIVGQASETEMTIQHHQRIRWVFTPHD